MSPPPGLAPGCTAQCSEDGTQWRNQGGPRGQQRYGSFCSKGCCPDGHQLHQTEASEKPPQTCGRSYPGVGFAFCADYPGEHMDSDIRQKSSPRGSVIGNCRGNFTVFGACKFYMNQECNVATKKQTISV